MCTIKLAQKLLFVACSCSFCYCTSHCIENTESWLHAYTGWIIWLCIVLRASGVVSRFEQLEKQYKQALREKDLMEKKMQRLEKSRDSETQELKERLVVAQEQVGHQV